MRSKKPPDPLNQLIGRNIRLYRIKSGLSQTALGESIGVSFQQIQKYEKAANRVPGSRLVQIARALGVPVAALWDDNAETTASELAPRLPSVPECRHRLMHAASKIADQQLLKLIADLVEKIAK